MSEKSDFEKPGSRRWVIITFVALTILIVLFGLAFLVSGREVVQRPLLVIAVVLIWFGTLGGIVVSRRDD
jgi:hypothetical protein